MFFFFICVLIAGLCRTCEIFGASSLVLDNLRHVCDKQFQSLSVSSELWLPLLEVTWIKVLILYTYLGFYMSSLTPVDTPQSSILTLWLQAPVKETSCSYDGH